MKVGEEMGDKVILMGRLESVGEDMGEGVGVMVDEAELCCGGRDECG